MCFQGLAAQKRFNAARRAEHVSGRSFGRTNGQLPGVVTEDPLDGLGLANIPHRGAGGMRVDVVDFLGTHPGVLEPHLDRPRRTGSLGIRRGHVVSIARVAIAHDLTIDASPALLGMFQLLEHQNRRPLPHHESIPIAIEGSTGVLRIFIAGGHGLHGRKTTHAQGHNGCLSTASEHDGRIAALDRPPSLTNGVVAGRAGRAGGKVGSAQVVVESEQTRGHVQDEHRDHERADTPWSLGQQDFVLLLGGVQAADARTDVHADVVPVLSLQIQTRIFQGTPTGIDTEVREAVGAAHFLRTRKCGHRIKPPHFCRDLAVVGGDVKGTHAPHTAFSGNNVFPDGVGIQPQRGGTTQTGHNHAAFRPSIRHSSGTDYPPSEDTQARVNLGVDCCLRSDCNEKGQLRKPGCPDEAGRRVTSPESLRRA